MNNKFLLAGAALVMFAACSEKSEIPVAGDKQTVVFSATMSSPSTKTHLGDDGYSVNWNQGDKITVFTDMGESATFDMTAGGDTPNANFSGTIGKSNSYMALYPDNSAATRISNVVNTSLPREQNLSANSFNNHLNVSVAYTENDQLFFNNAMGLIKFKTQNADGKNLTRVALRSQGGVLAADNISITMDGNSIASVAATANTHDNIELDALRGEYVSDNTTYYFVVMPGVLNGIELTFSNASGSSSYMRKGESSLTVESGKIADLGTIDINAIESNESGYEISEDGTTYRVSNADGLIAWANAARSNTSLNCVLLDNINMQDSKWTSVGSSENPYNGTFDGGGFTISNFTSEGSFIGWYEGSASNYEIKDLTIENVTVNAQGNTFCIGTFVGVIKGQGGNLTNLKAINVTLNGNTNSVGGIVGETSGLENNVAISNCSFDGTITGGLIVDGEAYKVGGIIGISDNNYVKLSGNTFSVDGVELEAGVMPALN